MRLLTTLVLALSVTTIASAQSTPRVVAVGDSIRVILLDGTKLPGRLDVTTDSTIMLRGGAFALPRHGIERIEVSAGPLGEGARALRGAKWGFLIGAAVGMFGSASGGGSGGGAGSYQMSAGSSGDWALIFAALGGVVGLPVGAVIGLAVPGTRWERAELPGVTFAR